MRRLRAAGVAITVLAAVGGCTHSPSVGGQRTGQPTTKGLGRIFANPSPARPFGTNVVTLTCADAGTGNVAGGPADLVLGTAVVEGMATGSASVPKAAEVGLILPRGLDWYFKKAPIWMKRGSAAVTFHLDDPGAHALAWVPSSIWTRGNAPDLRPWAATFVTFEGCPDRDATYFGGFLGANPDLCLNIVAQTNSEPAVAARVTLAGVPCHN